MPRSTIAFRNLSLLVSLLISVTAPAQIPPIKNDPLKPIQVIQGAGACSATAASSCEQAAAKIVPQVMGPSPMEENLRRLTDEIGGRVSGSPELAKAVAWGVAAFRAEGVIVHTEKYTLPLTWSEGDTSLELLDVPNFPIRLKSLGWSPETPSGGIEANLVDVGFGTAGDFARAAKAIKGAVLLVHTDVSATWTDLFNEYLKPGEILQLAVKGGAGAILWTGERERLLLYRHTNTGDGKLEVLPQAVVAREDALRLARTVATNPGKVRVRLSMPNKIGGPIEQENVVAEIRGYEKPDEAVILGAHLDSWDLGTGALDNGCNAALVIEAARAIRNLGLVPKRTIRFILFTGEEQGMLGSWAYVKAHRDELDKIRGVVIFDSGVGRVTGYSLGGRHDTETNVREILKPLDSWGVNQHTYDASIGTDNFDFLLEGVPTLVANNEVANYLQNYHAASDTFDKVDMRELKLQTSLAALTIWGIADRAEPIGKRLSRSELDVLMKESGLGEEMKAMGYWPVWMDSTRGRKP